MLNASALNQSALNASAGVVLVLAEASWGVSSSIDDLKPTRILGARQALIAPASTEGTLVATREQGATTGWEAFTVTYLPPLMDRAGATNWLAEGFLYPDSVPQVPTYAAWEAEATLIATQDPERANSDSWQARGTIQPFKANRITPSSFYWENGSPIAFPKPTAYRDTSAAWEGVGQDLILDSTFDRGGLGELVHDVSARWSTEITWSTVPGDVRVQTYIIFLQGVSELTLDATKIQETGYQFEVNSELEISSVRSRLAAAQWNQTSILTNTGLTISPSIAWEAKGLFAGYTEQNLGAKAAFTGAGEISIETTVVRGARVDWEPDSQLVLDPVLVLPVTLAANVDSVMTFTASKVLLAEMYIEGVGTVVTVSGTLSRTPAPEDRCFKVAALPRVFYVPEPQRNFEVAA